MPLRRPASARLLWAIASAIAIVACAVATLAASVKRAGQRHSNAAPSVAQTDPPVAVTRIAAPAQPIAAGQDVEVEWRGKWYPATVLAVETGQRFRVHYTGWGSEWDEIVEPRRVRPLYR